jgi:predicted Fe-Mo cluster-binding NifX family protein
MRKLLLVVLLVGTAFAQKPFESMEGVVGYIVIEKGGKTENYVVVEERDGKVKTMRVNQNPSQFLKKDEEGGKK